MIYVAIVFYQLDKVNKGIHFGEREWVDWDVFFAYNKLSLKILWLRYLWCLILNEIGEV